VPENGMHMLQVDSYLVGRQELVRYMRHAFSNTHPIHMYIPITHEHTSIHLNWGIVRASDFTSLKKGQPSPTKIVRERGGQCVREQPDRQGSHTCTYVYVVRQSRDE